MVVVPGWNATSSVHSDQLRGAPARMSPTVPVTLVGSVVPATTTLGPKPQATPVGVVLSSGGAGSRTPDSTTSETPAGSVSA